MSQRILNRIDGVFAGLKKEKRSAFIAYLTGGFPTLSGMDRAAQDLVRAGVDILEIGVPFSDPIADGPTIQFASQKALEGGATPDKILRWARGFRRKHHVPLVLMTYMNPVAHRGFAWFARDARASGVDGLIVPDLIPEEAAPLRAALTKQGIHLIHLVAPTTPSARRRWIARQSGGFLYAVSVTGVTGARKGFSSDLPAFLKGLRRGSPVPVAVGFGVATAGDARRLAPLADGVIVGSAFIQRLRNKESVAGLARALRAVLSQSSRTSGGRGAAETPDALNR